MPDDLTRPLVRPLTRPLERDARGQVIYPSLWQAFDKANRLRDAARIGPELTFSRPGPATYFDSSGILQTAAADEPRFDHDPATGDPLGLLIEESRTNSLLDNRDLSAGSWDTTNATVTQDQTGLDAASNTAWSITDDDASQNITVTDNSNTHTVSTYWLKTAADARVNVQFSGGTALDYQAVLDVSAGTATASGDAASADVNVEDAGDFWRLVVNAANNGTGNTTMTVLIRPDTLTETAVYDFGQVEENAGFATSPIETAGSEVTRAADVCETTDVGWINQGGAGTFVYEGRVPKGSSNSTIFYAESTFDNVIGIKKRTPPNRRARLEAVDNGSESSTDFSDIVSFSKIAVAFDENDFSGYQDGVQQFSFGSQSVPESLTKFTLSDSERANQSNQHIKSITYYPTRLSDAELKRLSNQ